MLLAMSIHLSHLKWLVALPRRLHKPIDNHTVGWDAWSALEVLKEILQAIQFLHEHHIIHGDLKVQTVPVSF